MTPATADAGLRHTPDLFFRRRRLTRAVPVGRVLVGGAHPLVFQSMTTTDTMDTEKTVAQSIRMVEAGCQIVRITTPTVDDARNLEAIKKGLLARGVDVPLAADVHFKPDAAMTAAEFAEKVRINPGNFVDGKRFLSRDYTDAEYAAELERIEARFTPLVEKLKRLKRALRIGTNHGSLSDRIMNRYGDSPLGMVESALEYVRVCEKNGYRDIILSMKASNPKVMVAAYRLLAARMASLGMDYPFHLGVTEAGDGEDGRIKSAIGIGSLLEDGIGDTIRVSLTEDPEFEIPVCRDLAARFQLPGAPPPHQSADLTDCADPFSYSRRETDSIRVGPFRLGGEHPVRVVTPWPRSGRTDPGADVLALLERQLKAPTTLEPEILGWAVSEQADVDALAAARALLAVETSRLAFLVRPMSADAPWRAALAHADAFVWVEGLPESEVVAEAKARPLTVVVEAREPRDAALRAARLAAEGIRCAASLTAPKATPRLHDYRLLAALLRDAALKVPIHISAPRWDRPEDQVLESAVLLGGLLCDGVGDSVEILSTLDAERNLQLVYNTLQGAGVRITKTEYVSCPSCGRTLFDLQETTERIKRQTGHLKGVKIAIMGCIVNGPGEMADADFGYVGGAPDMINLYVGKECVKKGIPTPQADRALIELIKAHGKWQEPKA
ncbi:MAG: (E)-4-hydroxy-3-methylbut-2-enyl-diphosphate synthase [Elusimicrobia bacterium]|nr:(E)-4-hydroxy-3-methylbut-2-enyl-diphosphate synthase [Elusimicrobiota bacterium]